ncbi:MAG: FHA domain-containing protein [Kiritimatiellae bacterium]|nr:FHA domain-containing protein [Kiritimatiellia bacterium]
MYRIIFLSGPHKGKRLAVQQQTVMIGRDPDCHVHLDDKRVSWQHAVIEERPDGVFIRDVGALNKIEVNSQEVRESMLLHGDEITLGDTKLQFQLIQPLAAENARRISHVQGITFALVALIILVEILFLVGLSMWRVDRGEWVLQVRKGEAEPVAEESAAEMEGKTEEQKEEAKEEEAAQEPQPAPAAEAVAAPAPAAKEPGRAAVEEEVPFEEDEDVYVAPADATHVEGEPAEAAAKPAEPPPLPVEPETPKDPLLQLAQEMVADARLEISRHNFVQADQQFERVQIVAPSYLPAYAERARLFEKRGMTDEAAAQWNEVLNRGKGTMWYEYAVNERNRLAQQQILREGTKPKAAETTVKDLRLGRKVRLDSVERQKLPATEEFDEMRLITMVLRPYTSRPFINAQDVKVHVTFYDREAGTDAVAPTGAMVPENVLQFDGEWPRGERRTVSAAYIVPKGFREAEQERLGKKRTHYGYIVRVFYEGQLQDVSVRPQDLMELVTTEDISPQ